MTTGPRTSPTLEKSLDFVPSDIFKNDETERSGKKLTHDQICTHNGACLRLGKQENITSSAIVFGIDFLVFIHQSNLGGLGIEVT
mgnify:CR=1 FL=1